MEGKYNDLKVVITKKKKDKEYSRYKNSSKSIIYYTSNNNDTWLRLKIFNYFASIFSGEICRQIIFFLGI